MVFRDKELHVDWSVREIIHSNGEHFRKYYFKDKQALSVRLEGELVKRLAGLTLIEKDLRNVISWLSLLKTYQETKTGIHFSKNKEENDLMKALWVASITSYGKCFVSSDGRGTVLNEKFVDKEFKSAHKKAMHYRHNFAAHAGVEAMESAYVSLVLPANKKKAEHYFTSREIGQQVFASLDNDVELIGLAENVQKNVLAAILKLQNEVLEKVLHSKTYEYWYRLAK